MTTNQSASKDDSDVEDYMSDTFLDKCGNAEPSLIPERIAKKYQMEKKRIESNIRHNSANKSVRLLESESREEGLKNALTAENKGFIMLKKMGYKPGSAIGKNGVGKIEPVTIHIKTGREGLGQELDRKRKQEERLRLHTAMVQKRLCHEAEWKKDVRSRFNERGQEKDLLQSQRVCQQLDEELAIEEPIQQFFWPSEFILNANEEEEEEDRANHTDVNPENIDALTTSDKLVYITDYLRSRHLYCTWCGTKFDDENDMKANCPEDTAEDHC